MSGLYQHYLQQMLQKGFKCAGGSKKNPSVWFYTKNSRALFKRIEKIGAEHEFYSTASTGLTKTLDDKITEWEAHRQADVRNWRNLRHGSTVSRTKAANLVDLTGARTKATRQVFQTVIEDLLPKFGLAVQDPNLLLTHLEKREDIKSKLKDSILRHLISTHTNVDELAASDAFNSFLRMLVYAFEGVASHTLAKALRGLDLAFQNMLKFGVIDIGLTHRNALEKQLDEASIRADLLGLNWWISRSQAPTPWILPDCAILELNKKGNYTQFMFRQHAELDAVVLPLSDDCALVGSVSTTQEIDLKLWNEAAAACSVEFFIASQNLAELEALTPSIGSQLTEGLIGSPEDDLNDLYTISRQKEAKPNPKLESLDFQVQGLEITENELRSLENQIVPYFASLRDSFDLSRIKRVVICDAIEDAAKVDSSSMETKFPEGDLHHYIWWQELGKTDLECTLYLQIGAAYVLAGIDYEKFDFTHSLLLQNLAQIHIRAIILQDSARADLVNLYINPEIPGRLRDNAMQAAKVFMETRYGCSIAGIETEKLLEFQHNYCSALDNFASLELPIAGDQTQNNKRAYAIAQAVDDIMCCAAKFTAVCDYLRVSVTDAKVNGNVVAALDNLHLREWMNRLDFEFQKLRVNFVHPLDPQRMFALQTHAERLYWARGMILLPEGFILPLADENLKYESIRSIMDSELTKSIPNDLSEIIASAMSQSKQDD